LDKDSSPQTSTHQPCADAYTHTVAWLSGSALSLMKALDCDGQAICPPPHQVTITKCRW